MRSAGWALGELGLLIINCHAATTTTHCHLPLLCTHLYAYTSYHFHHRSGGARGEPGRTKLRPGRGPLAVASARAEGREPAKTCHKPAPSPCTNIHADPL